MAQLFGTQLAGSRRCRATSIALSVDASRRRGLTKHRDVEGQLPHVKLLKRWVHFVCTPKFQQRARLGVTVNSYSLCPPRLVVSRCGMRVSV